ncbi:hypothetical protein DEEACLCL_00132 [Salmonella phage CRW-SP2]|nr:hypothetical protein DEEACLCL_00132 [Salmonella phage CRW-SP2]
MSYILHVTSGLKFDFEGKEVSAVQKEIKEAGLTIGNVTLGFLMSGRQNQANGFEVIESLSEEELRESQEALAAAKAAEEAPTGSGEVKEGEAPSSAEPSADQTVDAADQNVAPEQPAAEVDETPVSEEETVEAEKRAEEIRRRLLGDSVAEALNNVNSGDTEAVAAGQAVIDAKARELKPTNATEERKRRHTKREEMVDAARASQYGDILAEVEKSVVPGVYLSYVNPDMRWFQFPVAELADQANPHARTNTYIDLAPIVTGGWGFSLYVNGKSATKRVKIKEIDAASLVAAINAWLPGAIAETKTAA